MKTPPVLLLALAGLLVLPCHPLLAQAPSTADIDQAVREASAYSIEGPRQGLARLETLIRRSRPGDTLRNQIEVRLVSALSGDASDEAKRFFCRYLWIIGSDRSIPTLERMLLVPDTTHFACYALLNHPAKTAETALRRALDHTDGLARLGVINTIGDRRETRLVPVIGDLAAHQDPAIAEAAIAALGRIGGFTAADTLERLRRTAPPDSRELLALALIQCAQRFARESEPAKAAALYQRLYNDESPPRIRRAALIGLIASNPGPAASTLVTSALKDNDPTLRATAAAQIPSLKDPNATRQFAGLLVGVSPELQLLLIEALANREDLAARPALETLLRDPNPDVSLAATRAIGRFADPSSAPALLQRLASSPSPEQLQATLAALRQLSGSSVNEAIIANLKSTPAPLKPQLFELLADRRATSAIPTLLTATSSSDPAVAKAAFRALAHLATPSHLDALLDRLLNTTDPILLQEAEAAVLKAAQPPDRPAVRPDPILNAYAKSEQLAQRLALLNILAALGGPQALDAVQAATTSDQAALRDPAARLLASWPDPSAIQPLLKLATTAPDQTLRVLSLRGALRLLGDANNLPSAERLAACRTALELATQTPEKRLALASLAEAAFPGSLDLVLPYLDDPEVNPEACLAALRIAKTQINTQKDAARGALEKIVASTRDDQTRDQARELLKQLP